MGTPSICSECGASLSDEQAQAGVCPRCAMRLVLGGADDRLTEPPESPAADGTAETSREIGPYVLIRPIGEGGMGEVFLAEQREPIQRQVALKVIKQGMDTKRVVARFEAERQALALMDHASIAKVFDAGATPAGRPFFVMEYVQGEPITEYADRMRLSLRARLDLFGRVCAGVQHAHQKGVIHRDLKPSNVLVAEQDGEALPKIIDFGVAKAISKRLTEQTLFTELGIMIGTPEYMSPEQAEVSALDVDTRTDVYSLGVILYELLTGVLPFDPADLRRAGHEEIRRRIREEEPATPSSRVSTLGDSATDAARSRRIEPMALQRALQGDLDWIVLRALAKERERRYGSPAEFAADVTRYLGDEPVVARPPSAAYKARKFVRRNKLLASSAAIVFVTLVAGVAGTTTFGLREARERKAAEAARSDLEQVVEFQQGMLSDIDPEAMGQRLVSRLRGRIEDGPPLTIEQADAPAAFDRSVSGVNLTDAALDLLDEEILANAAEEIGSRFADQPIVEARLRRSLGSSYYELGMLDHALTQYERAYELLRHLDDDSDVKRSAAGSLGRCYWQIGRTGDAEPLFVEVLESNRRNHGEDHIDTVGAMSNLGLLYTSTGRFQGGHDLHQASLPIYRRLVGDDDPLTLEAIGYLAEALRGLRRGAEAETLFRQQLEARTRVLGADDPDTVQSMSYLAATVQGLGRLDEARLLQEEVLRRAKSVFGNTHYQTIGMINNLAGTYSRLGEESKAEFMFREALALSRKRISGDNRMTIQFWDNLAKSLLRQGRVEEGAAELEQVAEMMSRVYRPGDYRTIATLTLLVDTYDSLQRPAPLRTAAFGLADSIRSAGDGESLPPNTLNSIAWGLLFSYPEEIRDPEKALSLSLRANEMTGHENHLLLDTLAFAYFENQDVSSAIDTEQKAIKLVPPDDAERRAEFEANLARFEAVLAGQAAE